VDDIAIKVENLTKIYPLYNNPKDRMKEALHPFRKKYHHDFYALKDVTFEIKKGETVGIIGKNGAGKSTLLKILTGVLTPTSGKFQINGRICSLLELGTGFNPELNGYDNIFFYGTINGIPEDEMRSKVDEIIAFADIGEHINQPIKSYSSGMLARLGFSAATMVEPDILIVDEVLSVGDFAFQKKCIDKIKKIVNKGVSILLVSHDSYTIKNTCSRAIYLRKGESIFVGESNSCICRYEIDVKDSINSKKNICEKNNKNIFEFSSITLLDKNGSKSNKFKTNDQIELILYLNINEYFQYNYFSCVINLYTNDGFYVTGTTTLMEGYKPLKAEKNNYEISIIFPHIPLLSGKYYFRLAINDETGQVIYLEKYPVCEFIVTDDFQAEGLVVIEKIWSFKNGTD